MCVCVCVCPSLLPALSKILESVVVARVTDPLEKHHFLCSRQFAIRQGRSAAELHLLLASDLNVALDQSKAATVVALDIEGAFDRVWHEAGSENCATGIDETLLPLFRDYLSDRHLKVTVSGRESEVQPIEAGVPRIPFIIVKYINI